MATSDQIALAAVVVSLLSFMATAVATFLGRRYTRQQMAQAMMQIEETKQQFLAMNISDVELYNQFNPPGQEGVYLRATNHHPTIAVNELKLFAIGESP